MLLYALIFVNIPVFVMQVYTILNVRLVLHANKLILVHLRKDLNIYFLFQSIL